MITHSSEKTAAGYTMPKRIDLPLILKDPLRQINIVTAVHLAEIGELPAEAPPAFSEGFKYGEPTLLNGVVVVQLIALTQAESDNLAAGRIKAEVDRLWEAAHSIEFDKISGVAVGLLTLGVMQQLPVSLAIAGWSARLWTEYETRKAVVLAGGLADTDFSAIGAMPHSIPALRAELGM